MILNSKKIKFHLKILLLVIFFAVVSFEVYKSIHSGDEVESTKYFDKKILEALEINIQAGTKFIRLAKVNDSWKITDPIEDFASEDLIKSILNDIYSSTTEGQFSDSNTDWSKYDLVSPVGDVSIKAADGYKLEISISLKKAYNGSTYLKLNKFMDQKNEHFILISNMAWMDLIFKAPLDFVSKKDVFDFQTNEVKSIDLPGYGLFSRKDNLWDFKAASNQKVDSAKAEKLISMLKKLNIFEFEAKSALKSAKVVQKVDILLTSTSKVHIRFYDHFKPCVRTSVRSNLRLSHNSTSSIKDDSNSDLEVGEKCQLVSVDTAEHPFWVFKSAIAPILSYKF